MSQIKDAFGRDFSLEEVLDNVGEGWRPLVKRLIEDLFELGWNGSLHQIKEKFGGLRFYVGEASRKVFNRIELAELESLVTCEECGLPGKQSSWGGGWIYTLCEKHGEERENEIRERRLEASKP